MEKVVYQYQNKIHHLLREYLEFFSLTLFGRLTYPLIDIHKNKFTELIKLIEEFPKDFDMSKTKKIIKKYSKQTVTGKEYALIISTIHKNFYKNPSLRKYELEEKSITLQKNEIYNNWSNEIKKDHYLEPLQKINKNVKKLQGYVSHFFIQGSMATLDYEKGFSDVDSIMVVKKETIENPERLFKFRKKIAKIQKYFFLIDSSQHHGIVPLTEYELNFYPQTYFPLIVFEKSVALLQNNKEIKFKLRNDNKERKNAFIKAINYFEKVHKNKIKIENKWQWKLFISKILLLPTLYLQAKGNRYCKKDSFNHIKDPAISKASEIRKKWKPENRITQKIIKILIMINNPNLPLTICMSKRFNLINKEEKRQIKKEAFKLATKMKNELYHE